MNFDNSGKFIKFVTIENCADLYCNHLNLNQPVLKIQVIFQRFTVMMAKNTKHAKHELACFQGHFAFVVQTCSTHPVSWSLALC